MPSHGCNHRPLPTQRAAYRNAGFIEYAFEFAEFEFAEEYGRVALDLSGRCGAQNRQSALFVVDPDLTVGERNVVIADLFWGAAHKPSQKRTDKSAAGNTTHVRVRGVSEVL